MGESIIFASYFAMYPNPQGKNYRKDKTKYIQPLYDSVVKLGLNMIIFHDHLSDKFIRRNSTDKIRFEKYIPRYKIPFMSRFYCYLDYLTKNTYDKILCLDCGDLELYKNPFPLIDDKIMIGSEDGLIEDSTWMRDQFRKAYGETLYGDRQILNCGIIGGRYNALLVLLTLFEEDTRHIKSNIVDMAVFNKLIYDSFNYDTGHPIHTVFGKNEGRESGCYIRHK